MVELAGVEIETTRVRLPAAPLRVDVPVPSVPFPPCPGLASFDFCVVERGWPVHPAASERAPGLWFGILGPLQVYMGDRLLDLGPPKQRAVLASLLVSANRVVSLDQLIGELWGEEPPPAATASLQAYIANLRRVLEPERPPRAPATVLVTRAPGYVLQVGDGRLDAACFAELVNRGRRLLGEGRPQAAHEVLDEALRLWRGPVLQEVAGYDFAAAEVTRLEALHVTACETQAEVALALGRHSQAVLQLEQLVADQPFRERPRELLMLALYRCGRQADALDLMARTRRELADELGIDPGPALQQLHAAILRHEPTLTWQPPEAPSSPAEPIRPTPAEPTSVAAQQNVRRDGLVGRDKPLSAMRAALDEALAGHGRVFLVAGEPGIGKTRLVQELAAAADPGVDVLWGRCHENGDVPAFWPWIQVVRRLAEIRGREALAQAAAAAGPHLAPLGPGLVRESAVTAEAPEHARLLLYDAAARLLLQLAAQRPLLLVLEDLHWADPPSLQLVSYLAGHLHGAPIFLTGTFREEASGDPSLGAMLAAVAREPATERFHLTGLTEEQVGSIIARRIGAPVSEQLASAVHERTDGNPFFVTELTRLLSSEGDLDDPATWPVPDNVRDVLRRRIARLPEQAASLLTIGAVVGRSFDFDVVYEVGGLDEEATLAGLEAAEVTGLLVESGEYPGRHRFVHALVRETLYEGISGIRRARMHARIGEALHARYGERNVDALAHHFWHAGPTVPARRTLTYVERAAETAQRSLAYERAVEQLRRAIVLMGRLDPGHDRDERELAAQCRLAALLQQTRGYAHPEVGAALARASALARQLSRTVELTGALRGLATFRMVSGDLSGARDAGNELMALGTRSGDREQLFSAHDVLGLIALNQGAAEPADAHLAEAVRLADGFDDVSEFPSDPPVSVRAFHALARWLLGDAEGAAALRSEAIAMSVVRGSNAYTRAFVLWLAAHLAVQERDLEATRRWAADAIALCDEHGFRLFGGICQIFDAWAGALQGEPGAARIRAVHGAIEASGARSMRHYFLGLLAEAEFAEGRPDDARRTLDGAFAEIASTGERFYEPALQRLRDRLRSAEQQVGGDVGISERSARPVQ